MSENQQDFIEDDDDYAGLTDIERQAELETSVILDEMSQKTVDMIVDKMMIVVDELSGNPLYDYQRPFARRILESVIINDGATLTALFARQSGKSETVANTIAAIMIMFPVLAKVYPNLLGRFSKGVWVGAFAPVDDQADNLYGRIVSRLTSDNAIALMNDPDINDGVKARGRTLTLESGSLVRKQTCHPRAIIEGRTYHIILIDECFPAGTPVLTSEGWVPIDEIVNGDRRDWVVATQGADGGIDWAYVRTAYRTRRRNHLVRVDHEHGSIYCTADHPFVVGNERVAAQALTPGTELFLVPGAPEPSWRSVQKPEDAHVLVHLPVEAEGSDVGGESASGERRKNGGESGARKAESESVRVHAGEQPHVRSGSAEAGVTDAPGDRASSQGEGLEWSRAYAATEDAAGSARSGMGRRVCHRVWRREEEGKTPDTLQDRLGVSGEAAEGIVVERTRVVRVEVLEPGSPELDQFSDRGDYVYTLEVDSASHTYVAQGLIVGNCQGADDRMVMKSIRPMAAATNGTIIYTGTPTYTKNVFYDQIQKNKRHAMKRNARKNHFEADYKAASKANPLYAKHCQQQILALGYDSDEFKLSYRLIWLLEQGMFTTSEVLESLGDRSMTLVKAWHRTPVVVGIDPARKQDSTVVTVVFVDWDNPDEFGLMEHRILNWLELQGVDWETQYFRIVDFLRDYRVHQIGIEVAGVGDAVASRLKVLMPQTEIIEFGATRSEQSKRWKHLMNLMNRRKISWPAHAKTRHSRVYTRFIQQMSDLQLEYVGPYVIAKAPDESGAHDDHPDALALACALTADVQLPQIEQVSNFFYAG